MAKYVIGDNSNQVGFERANDGSFVYSGSPLYLQASSATSLVNAKSLMATVEGESSSSRNGTARILVRVRISAPNVVGAETSSARDNSATIEPILSDSWQQQEITLHTVLTVPKKLVDVVRATGAADEASAGGSSILPNLSAALNTLTSVLYGEANPLLSVAGTIATVKDGRLGKSSPLVRGLLGMTPLDNTYEQTPPVAS